MEYFINRGELKNKESREGEKTENCNRREHRRGEDYGG